MRYVCMGIADCRSVGIQPTIIQLLDTVNSAGAQFNDIAVGHRPTVLNACVAGRGGKSDFPPGADNHHVAGRRDQAINRRDQTTGRHGWGDQQRDNNQRLLLYPCQQDNRGQLPTIFEQEECSLDSTTIAPLEISQLHDMTMTSTAEISELRDTTLMTMTSVSSNNFSGCLSDQTTPTTSINAGSMHSSSNHVNGHYLKEEQRSVSKVKMTAGDQPSCNNGTSSTIKQQPIHSKIAEQDDQVSALSTVPRKSFVVMDERSCILNTEVSTPKILTSTVHCCQHVNKKNKVGGPLNS